MKKNILIILAIAFYSNIYCQGNLQFNRIINLEYSNKGFRNPGEPYVIYIDTVKVPPNKAWKIENSGTGYSSGSLVLNNYYLDHTSDHPNPFPIWLGQGNYLLKYYVSSISTNTPRVSISIIEFNIVP